MNKRYLKFALILLSFGVLFTAFAPYLSTRDLGIINFNTTGAIGDTIGGITNPITNLLGSILVFFALKAQIDTNMLIQKQFDEQKQEESDRQESLQIFEQISLITNDINTFFYSHTKINRTNGVITKDRYYEYKGSAAVYEFVKELTRFEIDHIDSCEQQSAFNDYMQAPALLNLLKIINLAFIKIKESGLNESKKQHYNNLLSYQFTTKIKHAFLQNKNYRQTLLPTCDVCGKQHNGIPEQYYEILDLIEMNLH